MSGLAAGVEMAVRAMQPTGGVVRAAATGRRSVRGPSRFREHLVYLVVSVVALHVAGFLSLLPQPASMRSVGAGHEWRMRVRTVDATHAAESSGAAGVSPTQANQPSRWPEQIAQQGEIDTLPAQGSGDLPVADRGSEAQAQSRPRVATQLAVSQQTEIAINAEAAVRLMQIEQPAQFVDDAELLGALASEAMGVESADGEGANQYWPRSALSVGPEPVAPVVLEFPAQAGMVGRYVTVLSVFIDEAGGVRRVRVDGPVLPVELDAVARQAFARARFAPGQINGRNVRSQIRVEVVFDSLPADASRSGKSGHGSM